MTLSHTSHDGLTLPAIGLGTYKLNGHAGADAIDRAIGHGYRLIDSAFSYENEGAAGVAVRRGSIPRGDVIVTSKLPGRRHAYDDALATIEESLFRTGLERIDLYLIHWPNPKRDLYVQAWRALIEARDRGLVGAIGVSNFLPEHLERLQRETGVLPAVNQIELHPRFPQAEALAVHNELGIITEAWSPIARADDVTRDPAVLDIAASHGVSPVQVVLAWHVARGVLPIPKATSDERQRENLAAQDIRLSDDEVASITALGRADGRMRDQDPAEYEEF